MDKSLTNAKAALDIKHDPELASLFSKLKREHAVQDNFVKAENIHFRISFDGHEHGSIRNTVLRMLEDAYRNVGLKLNYYPSETVTVILYSDRDFFDVTHAPSWAGGLFDGKIRIPVKGIKDRKRNLKGLFVMSTSTL